MLSLAFLRPNADWIISIGKPYSRVIMVIIGEGRKEDDVGCSKTIARVVGDYRE